MKELKQKLIQKLQIETDNITDYLETDKNVYRIETNVETNKTIFVNPTIESLNNQELVNFDIYQDKKDTISLITDENKLSNLIELESKFNDSQTTETNIFKNKEKIKYFYLKLNNIILVYRYTSRAYLKAKAFLKIRQTVELGQTKELELITEEDDRITLDKQSPDLIFDMDMKQAFLLNVKQSEYIIDLEVAIDKLREKFPDIQKENRIFSKDSFELFEKKISSLNKTRIRKFVKMIEEEKYHKFVEHRNQAVKIKERYSLTIEFNDCNEIVFGPDTSIEDILHLLADDYVQSYLDEESRVVDE
ncbi:hypothetical protein Hs30E_19120 [Lactococcus hodotermopsidis]|uniref:DUF4868 domain-containing protein n=1 Tax=Pseudolactococcus hodotermopsidis TaxID=2709157 RepID=A0A6A0BGH2_9LACT|nr:Kiwa anti-phage protein KwaB-like domain-containing protein [Lactococcus hodotermopsidis]GFH43361.1 hypothetical protein Hs30E_19120 [Lactococcus hodotermopsidis]